MATVSELGSRVTDSSSGRPIIAALASPGKALGATSVNIDAATNWTTTTPIHFSIYETVVVAGITVKDPDTQTDWKGVLAGTAIGSLTLTGGTDREYTAGAIVELTPTSRYAKDLFDWINSFANTDGTLKSAPIREALNLGSTALNGWDVLGTTISTVTYNGNRSYDIASTADVTGTISPGMRLRTTRTVAAPTQSTSLNGTNQYWSKTAPAGMTFTDDFVVSAWVKLTSYGSGTQVIMSRYNGTSGWAFGVTSAGIVFLNGYNGGAVNLSQVLSYQSLPLNKWVHVAAQLDMSAFTATTTTSYVMFDGLDVPCSVTRGGTNPTALVQAGNLEIGTRNGADFINCKIAQAAIFSAKVTQATMRGYISQGLSGTETSLVSAYSFNGVATDLNTTNANNLTASGSATATNADSPFGGQAGGTISSTLDYGIVQKVTASTITVQVAEGCTIPTSGGVSAASYSTYKSPFGFPGQEDKWIWMILFRTSLSHTNPASGSVVQNLLSGMPIYLPAGSWKTDGSVPLYSYRTTNGPHAARAGWSTTNASVTNPIGQVFHYSSTTTVQEMATQCTPAYKNLDFPTQATYYLYFYGENAANAMSIYAAAPSSDGAYWILKNAYL